MSSADASSNTSMEMPEAGSIDMKLEVVTLPVSDVDRAKRFYQCLGWRMDADIAAATPSGWSGHAHPLVVLDRLREGRHHR